MFVTEDSFQFVKKDFDSRTGKEEDAKYLVKRFRDLHDIIIKNLGKESDGLKSYSCKPNIRPDKSGKISWRKNA